MAAINVTNVVVKNNPCHISEAFNFQITFECLCNLKHDLEWRVIYVGTALTASSSAASHDIELECIELGPVTTGTLSFEFQANPPTIEQLPAESILGMQAVLVTASYRANEFIRIGYYVNNQYVDKELKENPPSVPRFDRILRYVISESPRITRFPINWDDVNLEIAPPQEPEMLGAKQYSMDGGAHELECIGGLSSTNPFALPSGSSTSGGESFSETLDTDVTMS